MIRTIVSKYFNIILLLVALVPLLALACYNHPSIVDDYCYIDTVFKYGYFEAMNFYYTSWTGRYFGIFLNHSNPLVWHWFAGFKVLAALVILGLLGSLYWFIKTIFSEATVWQKCSMTGAVWFLFVLKMPSVVEAFYWMAAFVTYTIPNTLTLCLLAVVAHFYAQNAGLKKYLMAVLAAFLVFATVGSSETNLIITLILTVGWFGFRLVLHRKFDVFALVLLLVLAFSCVLVFSSNGNANRLAGNPASRELLVSLNLSLRYLGKLSINWIVRSPLPFFTLCWVFFLRTNPNLLNNQYFAAPLWATGLVALGLLWGQIFASYYGIGIEPPPRGVNSAYLYFLLGWFYNIAIVVRFFAKDKPTLEVKPRVWRMIIILGILSVSRLDTSNLRMIYGDWLRGRAAAYNQELNARYDFIKNSSAETVVVAPLKSRPASLYLDDLHQDSTHLWNRCMGGYFGKKAITVQANAGAQ